MRRTMLVALIAALAVLAGLAAWMLAGGGWEGSGGTSRKQDAAQDVAALPRSTVDVAETPQALPQAVLVDSVSAAVGDAPPAAPEASLPPTYAFRGRVVDDAGVPIAGATVVYWPNELTSPTYGLKHDVWSGRSELDALPHASTDADGRFELGCRFVSGVGPGRGSDDPALVVIADGYAIRSRECRIYSGGDLDAGDIALEPGGWLEGRLVDARGQPVAGATIKPWNPRCKSVRGVAGPDESIGELSGVFAATLSEADGRFRTGGLWEGKVQVGITAEGCLDRWFNDYQPVTAGHATDLGDIVLDAGSVIAGQVRDGAGTGIQGARIVALSSERWSEKEPDGIVESLQDAEDDDAVLSDSDGRFVVPRLATINHSLLVAAPGYEPAQIDDLVPGRADLSVVLQRAAVLRLTVTSRAGGGPLPASQVRARRYGSREFNTYSIELPVSAGEGPGTFSVAGLGRVCTRVTVSAPGHATQILDIEPAVPPAQLERSLALTPESVLAGRVLGDDGTPIIDADLVLRWTKPDVEEDVAPVHPDKDGHFQFRGLAAGEWSLVADAPDRSPVARNETLGEGEARLDVDFVLPRAAEVFGTVYSEDGTPNAGAWGRLVRVTEDGVPDRERDIRADAGGRYEMRDLPIGRWLLSLGDPDTEFELLPGQRLQLDVRVEPGTRLEGRVLNADGTPVAGAWVFVSILVSEDTRVPSLCQTDEHGHWQSRWVRPGRLEIVASLTQGGGSSERVVVDLHEGDRRSVDLHLGAGRVTGRVVQSGGEPLPNATVRLEALADDGEAITWGNFGTGADVYEFGVVTDADGRFTLGHLGAARYAVSVDAPGVTADEQAPFTLEPAATVDLLIPVTRTGRISGHVTLASGVPVHESTYLRAEGPGNPHTASVRGGRYELKGLRAGSWRLLIDEDDRILVERRVELAEGQELEVDLVVP